MATSERRKIPRERTTTTRQLHSPIGGDGQHRAEPAEVGDAITHLRHTCDIQFKRIAQMQADIDTLKATLAKLTGP
jgi:hypothetical protein